MSPHAPSGLVAPPLWALAPGAAAGVLGAGWLRAGVWKLEAWEPTRLEVSTWLRLLGPAGVAPTQPEALLPPPPRDTRRWPALPYTTLGKGAPPLQGLHKQCFSGPVPGLLGDRRHRERALPQRGTTMGKGTTWRLRAEGRPSDTRGGSAPPPASKSCTHSHTLTCADTLHALTLAHTSHTDACVHRHTLAHSHTHTVTTYTPTQACSHADTLPHTAVHAHHSRTWRAGVAARGHGRTSEAPSPWTPGPPDSRRPLAPFPLGELRQPQPGSHPSPGRRALSPSQASPGERATGRPASALTQASEDIRRERQAQAEMGRATRAGPVRSCAHSSLVHRSFTHSPIHPVAV